MTTWDLSELKNDFDSVITEVRDDIDQFKETELRPDNISKLLKLRETINTNLRTLGAYYELKLSEDTTDQEVLAMQSKLEQVSTDIANELLFFKHWFIELDDETARSCKEHVPDRAYYLEQLRKDKPFTLEEEQEQLLNIKEMTGGDAFSDVYEVMTNQYTFDFQGETVTKDELLQYTRDDDPQVREDAYDTLLQRYAEDETVLGELYKNVVLDWYNEGVKIRGHDTPIAVRNHGNDVSDEAVETLLQAVEENVDIFTSYFKQKHAFLNDVGQSYEHSRYHIYAPYTTDRNYPYEDSKEYVLNTFKQFDERFYRAAKTVFDDDHIHSHPKTGKRGGAFNFSVHNDITPYVLLNHTGTLRDLFTMAHELGHAVHGVLAQEQPNLVYNASLPMAETASVFAEMLVAKRLLNKGSEEEQLATLIYMLDKQYGTVTRQAYFTRFEQRAHQLIRDGEPLKALHDAWMNTLDEQFGEMHVPDVFRNEWQYVPHFQHSPFYCYAYSWGNLLVLSLYDTYEQQGEAFIDDYLEILRAGGSAKPKDLLSKVNIDPSDRAFWQRGFDLIREEVEWFQELSGE